MHASKIFSILAFAAAAIAAPMPDDQGVVIVTEMVTKYVTAGVAEATPAPAPAPTPVAVNTPHVQASATAVATSAASTDSDDSSSSSGSGYMSIVNKYRKKMGLKDLQFSDKLQGNCKKTTEDSNGSMVHELNPGSNAQVLAPGSAEDLKSFEKAFVGGWICERPNLLSECSGDLSSGWAQNGETGHADILISSSYSSIGCADTSGIVCCDLS